MVGKLVIMSEKTTAKVAMFTIDCADPAAQATFWSALTGAEVAVSTDDYAMLTLDGGPALGFGKVEDYEAPAWPNEKGSKQFHLDLAVDDIAAAEKRALELGAALAEPQPGEGYRVLLDPAGHPFCLTDAANWG